MRILLTGARYNLPDGRTLNGFIGGRFAEIYDGKYEIVLFDSDIRFGTNGIYDPNGFDAVVHLAARAGVRRSHEEPNAYWEVNVRGSKRLFDFFECPIIYASSSSVYEWWLSPYAMTKKAMETVAPFNSLGLRFHTVYGPNSRPDMLYDQLVNRSPDVKYLTNHTRDWTHVDDVCSAIDICIQNFPRMRRHRAIDVGTGSPVKVVDMANKVWPGHSLTVQQVTGEREHTCADPSILKSFGWEPIHHIMKDG